jgi:hypothetical protein
VRFLEEGRNKAESKCGSGKENKIEKKHRLSKDWWKRNTKMEEGWERNMERDKEKWRGRKRRKIHGEE